MEVCHHYVLFFAWFTSLDRKKDWKLKKPGLRTSLFAWNHKKRHENFILIIIGHLVHRALGCAIRVETQSNLFIGVTTTNSFCNPIVVAAERRNRCCCCFFCKKCKIYLGLSGGGVWSKLFFVNASSDLRIAGEGLVSGLDSLTQGRCKPGSRSQLSHIRSLRGWVCTTLCCVVLCFAITCFFGWGHHRNNGDQDWADDVDCWEDEVDLGELSDLEKNKSDLKGYKEEDRRLHLDRSLPLWVLPAQIRQTEDSQADGKLPMGLGDDLCFCAIFMIFWDQGQANGKLRLGLVDDLCFPGGIFMIFGDQGQADGKLRLGLGDGLCFLRGIFMIFGDKARLMEN